MIWKQHLSKSVENRIKKTSRYSMIFYSIPTPTGYISLKDWGVPLTFLYLIYPINIDAVNNDFG